MKFLTLPLILHFGEGFSFFKLFIEENLFK
ncbi:hypothetical protein FORC085_870 [Bacillus cereus]|nr:hypothetical protein FORC48_0842 [Bacillus cereus]QBZ23940.1 hypothetical protein FORC085_870 [Bacillus cereus]